MWEALGDVPHYVEPFAGSLAVMLERPEWHVGHTETVNDKDAYLANFWRALKRDPEGVAEHASDPVNETDLIARHLWLVNTGRERIGAMEADPEFYDAKVAGWWVWGQCAWIGSGWCSDNGGPWVITGNEVAKLPHLGNPGRGVNRKLPHLGDSGRGVNRQLPHLGDSGRGVNRQLPHLGDSGRVARIRHYMHSLASRLQSVRVCCGDWRRIVTDGALSYPRNGPIGVFLDPPYLADVRTADLYTQDDATISHAVREWAIEHGDDPKLRIVLAGYEDEHASRMPDTWRVHAYSAGRAYGTSTGADSGNRHNERLWFSPHCLNGDRQGSLFGEPKENA